MTLWGDVTWCLHAATNFWLAQSRHVAMGSGPSKPVSSSETEMTTLPCKGLHGSPLFTQQLFTELLLWVTHLWVTGRRWEEEEAQVPGLASREGIRKLLWGSDGSSGSGEWECRERASQLIKSAPSKSAPPRVALTLSGFLPFRGACTPAGVRARAPPLLVLGLSAQPPCRDRRCNGGPWGLSLAVNPRRLTHCWLSAPRFISRGP